MHLKRLIVALILLPVIYLYIMYLPQGYFFLLLTCGSIIAMLEFYAMYRVTGILRYAGLFFGVSILCVSYVSKDLLKDLIPLSVMAIMGIRLLSKRNPVSSLSDIAPPVIGVFYIAGLATFQIQIREFGPEWIVLLYVSVWASDSLAYYLGTLIGKKKLYAEVSPNKTVAGAFGSLIGGATGVLLFKIALITELSVTSAFLIGITTGTASVIGDLVESMFKRDAGVKDSGIIVPGHGGMLDKVDGVLFAGPVLYAILIVIGIK